MKVCEEEEVLTQEDKKGKAIEKLAMESCLGEGMKEQRFLESPFEDILMDAECVADMVEEAKGVEIKFSCENMLMKIDDGGESIPTVKLVEVCVQKDKAMKSEPWKECFRRRTDHSGSVPTKIEECEEEWWGSKVCKEI